MVGKTKIKKKLLRMIQKIRLNQKKMALQIKNQVKYRKLTEAN
jgi:hypothetical protein